MRQPITTLVALGAVAISTPSRSQGQACLTNPDREVTALDSVAFEIGSFPVKICYQRLPVIAQSAASSWRSVGQAAPVLHTTALLDIAGVRVGSGSYTLYVTPQPGKWLLQVIRVPDPGFEDLAGSIADREVGRSSVTVERARPPSETLDIQVGGSGRTAILFLTWGEIEITIPVVQQ